jgi:hypothetical protein
MHFSTIVGTLATASLATARFTGIITPGNIKAGDAFTFILTSEEEGSVAAANSTESSQAVAVSWGFSDAGIERPFGSVGKHSAYQVLGPEKSNIKGNLTINAYAPRDAGNGIPEQSFTVAVHELVGQYAIPITRGYSVGVLLGNDTNWSHPLRSGGSWDWIQYGAESIKYENGHDHDHDHQH